MISELGFTVARQIPIEMIGGLLSGAYSLHGGVIRNGAGQIVAHLAAGSASTLSSLVPGLNIISSAVANGQLLMLASDVKELQSAVSTVLNVASAGAAISGLGLVVSIAGFTYLSNRFKQIETLLLDIKDLIETRNLADLKAAMGYMKDAEAADSIGQDNRRSLLLEAQKNFSTLAHLYGDLWEKTENTKQIQALENFYTLAFTGASIANSELGMHEVAVRQFNEHFSQWRSIARRQTKSLVLSKDPSRFQLLSSDVLSTAQYIDMLDFANGTKKGIAWLDEFRPKPSNGWMPQVPKFSIPWDKFDQEVILIAKQWVHRNAVLDSHKVHLEFLAKRKLSVGQFSKAVILEAKDQKLDAICVLQNSSKFAA